MRFGWVIGILGLLCLGAFLLAADKRKPEPPTEAQAKAEKLIKDVFKKEYAKTKAADKVALAGLLRKQAEETKDDPASKYVLLREARDLALQAGDLSEAFEAIDELSQEFEVSGPALKATAADKVKLPADLASHKAMAETILLVVEEAVDVDDFESALNLLKSAEAAARRSRSVTTINQATGLVKEVETLKKDLPKFKEALAKLAKDDKDPDANLVAGKYVCFAKGDWDKGLPMLAKSDDAKLKALAAKDLAGTNDASEQVGLGDAWYDLAGTGDELAKINMQLRAHHWYQLALDDLSGLTKAKVEKRIAELDKVADSRVVNRGSWRVVFRSADPTIWNKDVNRGRDYYALDLRRVANNVEFLRLTLVKTKEAVIVPIAKKNLIEASDDGRYGWEGRCKKDFAAYHLGIYDKQMKFDDKKRLVVHFPGGSQGLRGWGFGHRAYKDDRQGYSWGGEEIEQSVFEIAVKAGVLTPSEIKKLLKK